MHFASSCRKARFWFFVFIVLPASAFAQATITSFTPTSGVRDTVVTISGSNFSTVMAVRFNGFEANYSVESSETITAIVPGGNVNGPITVQTIFFGTATSSTNFSIAAPTITSISPRKVVANTGMLITGTNLTDTSAVSFNGTAGTVIETDDPTTVYAIVPAASVSGPLSVTTPGGTANSPRPFERVPGLLANPDFESEVYAWSSTTCTVCSGPWFYWHSFDADGDANSGSAIINNTVPTFGAMYASQCVPVSAGTAYTFGGRIFVGSGQPRPGYAYLGIAWHSNSSCTGFITSIFSSNYSSPQWSTASVTGTAVSGAVAATALLGAYEQGSGTPGFSALFDNTHFDAVRAPTVSSFSPGNGPVGTFVTIHGQDFYGTSNVYFNGLASTAFTVHSSKRIVATVPPGASSGPVAVSTPGGTTQSAASFQVLRPPTISSFTPTSGPAGTQVNIYGERLDSVSSVRFNGWATPFIVIYSFTEPPYIQTSVPAAATTGPIRLDNAAGFVLSSTSFVIRTPQDFNGDAKADLLWRNYTTGDVNIWFIANAAYAGGANLFTVADANWRLETSGDFDRNGSPDLLWRNYSTGDVNIWFLSGSSYIGGANLFNVSDLNWEIEGAADFDGDGDLDIIWRNYSTGDVNVWFLNGTTFTSGANMLQIADVNWRLEGTGDFDNDGDPDLVWRNYSTGAVNIWILNGTTFVSGVSLITVADPLWKIQAIEDYNGNGGPDLVWRHYGTGAVNIWRMNGTSFQSGANLFTVGTDWQIAGPR